MWLKQNMHCSTVISVLEFFMIPTSPNVVDSTSVCPASSIGSRHRKQFAHTVTRSSNTSSANQWNVKLMNLKSGNLMHTSESQQKHLLVLLGAFQETKRKLHNTTIKLLETRLELEDSNRKPAERKTLKKHGDEVTFHMTNFSLYKQTGRVWHSPPLLFSLKY